MKNYLEFCLETLPEESCCWPTNLQEVIEQEYQNFEEEYLLTKKEKENEQETRAKKDL